MQKRALAKIQPIHDWKTKKQNPLRKLEIEENFLSLIIDIYEKTTVYTILYSGKKK